MIALAAAMLTLAGAFLLYLGTPNQRLLTGRHTRRPLLWAGGAGCLVALSLLLTVSGPAAAVFIWLTLGMLLWSVIPLIIAWRRAKQEPGK